MSFQFLNDTISKMSDIDLVAELLVVLKYEWRRTNSTGRMDDEEMRKSAQLLVKENRKEVVAYLERRAENKAARNQAERERREQEVRQLADDFLEMAAGREKPEGY